MTKSAKLFYWHLVLFVGLMAEFVVSRLYCLVIYRSFDTGWQEGSGAAILLVGLLSDIWVAWLLAFVLVALRTLLGPLGIAGQLGFRFVTGLTALLLAFHVGYFAFYKSQFDVAHFAYLFDFDFLSANRASIFDLRIWLSLSAFVAATLLMSRPAVANRLTRLNFLARAFAAFGLFFCSIVGHSANIHYRVQWNTPFPLAVNVIEHLYLNSRYSPFISNFANDEWRQRTELSQSRQAIDPVAQKLNTVTASAELLVIKDSIAKKLHSGHDVFVTVILMESARYYDFLNKPNGGILTPIYDQLRAKGLEFTQTYSTGKVTRGAQEAIWCAYPGNEYNSLMRQRPNLNYHCLPKYAPQQNQFHWLHGGSFAFDQQGPFWKRQGVAPVLSQEDFSADAVRTDWGVSDFALFKKAAKFFNELNLSKGQIHNTMILTMTNHIPWQLPGDAPELMKMYPNQIIEQFINNFPSSFTQGGFMSADPTMHPTHRTIAYTDSTIGWFVDQLKKNELWHNHLLILVGDHGLSAPFYSEIAFTEHSKEIQLTHIPLLLSGGIVESSPFSGEKYEHAVSQLNLATTLAFINEASAMPVVSPDLFIDNFQLEVFADLADVVFYPKANAVIERKKVAVEIEKASTDEALARIYSVRVNNYIRALDPVAQ